MQDFSYTLVYGKNTLSYEVLFTNRKTLEIAVHPNKNIVVKAPQNTTINVVQEKVEKRSRWICRQLRYFEQFNPRTPERIYVGGESHLYLGRHYRLKIAASNNNQVSLSSGFIHIETKNKKPRQIKKLLGNWYREKAVFYFNNVFQECWQRFHHETLKKPTLRIQQMKKRWGSLSKKGNLTLNLDLIRAPKECIEYVIIHEFCHLIHQDHNQQFYTLLDSSMPDWLKRKYKLETALI